MSKIDWSKAPEGATHYGESSPSAYFYRIPSILGGHYDYWNTKSADPEWRSGLGDPVAPVLVARPAEWNGTGLPPVGAVCEMHIDDHGWERGTVVCHIQLGEPVAVAHNGVDVFHGDVTDFRPIRTTEQIAADERESAIVDIVELIRDIGYVPNIAKMIHDAGYRKQSTKQDDQQ